MNKIDSFIKKITNKIMIFLRFIGKFIWNLFKKHWILLILLACSIAGLVVCLRFKFDENVIVSLCTGLAVSTVVTLILNLYDLYKKYNENIHLKIRSYRKIQLFASRLFGELMKMEELHNLDKSESCKELLNKQKLDAIFNNFNMNVKSNVFGFPKYYDYFPHFINSILNDGKVAINSINVGCNSDILSDISYLVEEFSFISICKLYFEKNFNNFNISHILSLEIDVKDLRCMLNIYSWVNKTYKKLIKFQKIYPGYICNLK